MRFLRNSLSCIAFVLAATLAPLSAFADDMLTGWSVQFRQDTFDETTLPLATISEEGASIDKSLLAVACSSTGELVTFFQSGLIISFETTTKVQFKLPPGATEVVFAIGEIPHLGKRLMMDEKLTKTLLDGFSQAGGRTIAFRTDKKQGVFNSVGAKQAFEITRQNCPR